MSTKFIELTTESGVKVFINPTNISVMRETKRCTFVFMISEEEAFEVTESIALILRLITAREQRPINFDSSTPVQEAGAYC